MERAWAIFLWSLDALFSGTWPSRDWEGAEWPRGSAEAVLANQHLAGRHFGVPFLIKGDWDHFCKTYGLRHYASNEPCDHCRCSKDGPLESWPNNFTAAARWKRELIGPALWRRAYGSKLHALFQKFSFLSNANVSPH